MRFICLALSIMSITLTIIFAVQGDHTKATAWLGCTWGELAMYGFYTLRDERATR